MADGPGTKLLLKREDRILTIIETEEPGSRRWNYAKAWHDGMASVFAADALDRRYAAQRSCRGQRYLGTQGDRKVSQRYEYRLSWEIGDPIDPIVVEKVRAKREDSWQTLTDEEWAALIWRPVARVDSPQPSSQQFNTLRAWAKTHYRAIRNVHLERRPARDDDEGWEPVEGTQ